MAANPLTSPAETSSFAKPRTLGIGAGALLSIGGAIGVFLAWIIGKIMTVIFMQTYLSVAAIAGAIGVSALAGVISGLFPAWKAARLDPIEALRADG